MTIKTQKQIDDFRFKLAEMFAHYGKPKELTDAEERIWLRSFRQIPAEEFIKAVDVAYDTSEYLPRIPKVKNALTEARAQQRAHEPLVLTEKYEGNPKIRKAWNTYIRFINKENPLDIADHDLMDIDKAIDFVNRHAAYQMKELLATPPHADPQDERNRLADIELVRESILAEHRIEGYWDA